MIRHQSSVWVVGRTGWVISLLYSSCPALAAVLRLLPPPSPVCTCSELQRQEREGDAVSVPGSAKMIDAA